MGKGINSFSSGGLKQPFPNNFQSKPFPQTHYQNAKKLVIDGKPVYYVGYKHNAPSPRVVQKVYAKIPDDKTVPVVFQTKKQYLKEYIKNQELANDVKFSKREKEQYIKNELKDMQPVVSRFTTYHNDFMPPRTVFFTDNRFNKDKQNFAESAFHEYWHEKTEGLPHLQDDEIKAEEYAKDKMRYDLYSKNNIIGYHGTPEADKILKDGFDVNKTYSKAIWLSPVLSKENLEYTRQNRPALTESQEKFTRYRESNPVNTKNILKVEVTNEDRWATVKDWKRAQKEHNIKKMDDKRTVEILKNEGFRGVEFYKTIPKSALNRAGVTRNNAGWYMVFYPEDIKNIERINKEEIEKLKQEGKEDYPELDVAKNRLNKMQIERLKQLSIGYTQEPSKGKADPYGTVPKEQPVMISHILVKPESRYQAHLRSRALNILKEYPTLMTEVTKAPTQLIFYQGRKGAKTKGIVWATPPKEGEEPESASMVDITNEQYYKQRRMRDDVIARAAFHELKHSQQFAENPEEYEKRRKYEEEHNIEHSQRPDEISAELSSIEKVSDVDKGLGPYTSYLPPEDLRVLLKGLGTEEEEKTIYKKAEPLKEQYQEQIEKQKTAGIQMLDQGKNKTIPIHEDESNKRLRVNRGYKTLVKVDARKFKEEFEKEQQEPLAWSGERKESMSKLQEFDAYPQVDYNYKLDVNDGRHRLNKAAEEDSDIVVSVKSPKIVEKLRERNIVSTDESLDRLNKMQMERLRQIGRFGYAGIPSMTPKPYQYLPEGVETFKIYNIHEQPTTPYQKLVRNRMLNIIKKYPNIISEVEQNPQAGGLLFYQGPKDAEARGTYWEEKEGEKPLTLVDIRDRESDKISRRGKDARVARTVFHEIKHSQQYLDNPEEYKREIAREKQDSAYWDKWHESPAEKEAEEYAYSKITEVAKGTPSAGIGAYATPSEYFSMEYPIEKDKKYYEDLVKDLEERKRQELQNIEQQTTAGIQMLDQSVDRMSEERRILRKIYKQKREEAGLPPLTSEIEQEAHRLANMPIHEIYYTDESKDRRGWPQATHQEQLKGVEQGEKPIALVATESFNNSYIDTKLPFLEVPKQKHMGHQRIYYPQTEEGKNNAQKALSIMNKNNLTEQDHTELGKLFGYEKDEINNFLWAIKYNKPLYYKGKVINYKVDKNRIVWQKTPGIHYEEMTPDQYLQQIPYMEVTPESEMYGEQWGQSIQKVGDFVNQIKDPNIIINVETPYIFGRDQEGRHRAVAAKLAGLQTIPVGTFLPSQYTTPEMAVAFMEKMKSKGQSFVGGYDKEWLERFKKGKPEHYMGKPFRQSYKELLAEKGLDPNAIYEPEEEIVVEDEKKQNIEERKTAGIQKLDSNDVSKNKVFYHGYTERFLPNIRQHGLLPVKTLIEQGYENDIVEENKEKPFEEVFVATNPGLAHLYSESILKIDVPNNELKSLGYSTTSKQLQGDNERSFSNIPPKYIVGIKYGSSQQQWLPFIPQTEKQKEQDKQFIEYNIEREKLINEEMQEQINLGNQGSLEDERVLRVERKLMEKNIKHPYPFKSSWYYKALLAEKGLDPNAIYEPEEQNVM